MLSGVLHGRSTVNGLGTPHNGPLLRPHLSESRASQTKYLKPIPPSAHQKLIPELENDAMRACTNFEKQQGIDVVLRKGLALVNGSSWESQDTQAESEKAAVMGKRGTTLILSMLVNK
jgi:hypothetical protein